MNFKFVKLLIVFLVFNYGLLTTDYGLLEAAIIDSYIETFDNRQDSATIDGIDSWSVVQGETTNAITQSGITASGSGKSLKLLGAVTTTIVSRSAAYGSLTPTWIRHSVRSSVSAQNPDVPASGIGAVCFSYNGKVLAADGSSWVDTGMDYTVGQWYDVAMKLDFKSHRYDLYVSPRATPSVQFLPLKSNLRFIDTSVNTLSKLKFFGAFSATQVDDVFIDDVSVTYIERLEIISTPQKLLLDEASSLIIVQLQNSNAEAQTAINDITLELKSTSGRGRFSLNPDPWMDIGQVVIPKDAQGVSFYYKDNQAGSPLITISEYPDQGFTNALQQEEIVAQVSYFDLEADSPQIAGENFILRITAKDEEGNINESYAGSVVMEANYVSPSSGSQKLSLDNVSGFAKGRLEVILTYPDCGVVIISVSDSEDPSKTGTSSQILFLPAGFELSAERLQTVSKPFNLLITAKNIQGKITPNYQRAANIYPVAISPKDIPEAKLSPKTILADAFKDGTAAVSVNYNLYGKIKIRAEDAAASTRQGLSNELVFLPKGLSLSVEPAPGGREFFYIGEPINITLKIEDEEGKPISNYPGVTELISDFGLGLPSEYTFTPLETTEQSENIKMSLTGFTNKDAGSHKFAANPTQAGEYTVAANAEEGKLKAESSLIKVKNTFLQVIDTTSPIGSGEVIIQLVDELGEVIDSENNLAINVKAVEELSNNSAALPSGPITLTGGRAIIPVFDTEAETVTIVPSSPFKINIKKGTITFGKVSKSGIVPLMWRELKKNSPQSTVHSP